ncbi:hypothetical protein [Flavobacterium sp. 2]|uniref:hypothetical protein n=1 Tax=Flavobacterium sp. 2 TaxID=308053 RepID=UPI003CF7402C
MRLFLLFLFPIFFSISNENPIDWKTNMTLDQGDFYLLKSYELKGKVKSAKLFMDRYESNEKNIDLNNTSAVLSNYKGKLHSQYFFNVNRLLTKEIIFQIPEGRIFGESDYTYDKNQNLIQIRDKNRGFGRRFKYDTQNRRIEKSYFSGNETFEIHSFYYNVENPSELLKTLKSKAREHYVCFVQYDETNRQIAIKKHFLDPAVQFHQEDSIKYTKDSYFSETLSRSKKDGYSNIFKARYTYDENNNIISHVKDDHKEYKDTYVFDKKGNWILKIETNDRDNYVSVWKREIIYYP